MKKIVGISLGVVFLLLGTLLVIPAFVDLGPFKHTYLPLIEESLQRRVDVGTVRLRLLPTPSIRLSNLKISDSPTFSESVFFAAEQVQLRVKLWPLIRGRFEATEFVLEKPVMNLQKQPDGNYNYADLANHKIPSGQKAEEKKKKPALKSQEPVLPFAVPSRMRIKDGQLNFETRGQKPLSIKGIDLSLQELAGSQPFPYQASFHYAGLKSVSLEGWLSYQEEQATLKLMDNRLKVQDLVLPVHGSVTHLATAPRFQLSAANEKVDAKSIYQILHVVGLAPRDTDISGPMALHLAVSGPTGSLVTQVRGQLNNVKVQGTRAIKGNVKGEFVLKLPIGAGPVTRRLLGDGKFAARDGELTNVDVVRKIQRVTGMIGLSKELGREAASFRLLEAEFTIAGGLAEIKRLFLVNSQMEVHGSGTMVLDPPTLNLAVETTLSPQASARAGRSKTTNVFKDSQGRIVVPMKVTGPAANPALDLDSEKMLKRGMGERTQRGLGSLFEQLFPKR